MEDARLVWQHGVHLRWVALAVALLGVSGLLIAVRSVWIYGVRHRLIWREPGDVEQTLRDE